MNQAIRTKKNWLSSVIGIIIISLILNTAVIAQPDTLLPSGTINPFEVGNDVGLPFPLQHGEPLGDINGDGLGDFVFNKYAWNRLTEDLTDKIATSMIVADAVNPDSAVIMYGSCISGIGDYNGDGFDDMVDFYSSKILFGNANGSDFDTLSILLLEDKYDNIIFYGDITGDGNIDFIPGSTYYQDSLWVYSSEYTEPIYVNIDFAFFHEPPLFNLYDYDNDSEVELFVAVHDWERYEYAWFVYDSSSNQYDYEAAKYRYTISDPNYLMVMSDINGDGLKDICHTTFGFDMEVLFGTDQSPYYFDEPVQIEMGNPSRMLLNAGDFNGDGAEDWYSKTTTDSVVIYYGRSDIASQGFAKETYFIESNTLLMQPSRLMYLETQLQLFDYDGDGIKDIIFDYWDFNSKLRYDTVGMAIFTGSSSPSFESPIVLGTSYNRTNTELGFGKQVRNLGDLNNDGFKDWAILSDKNCELDIFFGGEELDFVPDRTILLPQYPFTQSYNFASGDLNADGIIDIVISNSSLTDVVFARGLLNENEYLYGFFGSPFAYDTLFFDDADFVIQEFETFYSLGKHLEIPGDYNADGYNDLVVGGGKHKECLREAFVFLGGEELSDSPDIIISVPCNQCGISFANPITACGDINNDGYDDFTLGDPQNGPGKSLIYYGGTVADSLYDNELINPVSNGRNYGAATPKQKGDFNYDGFPDLVQWNYYDDSIHIFKGGEEFDEVSDLWLTDTCIDVYLSCIDFVNDFSDKGQSDLLMSNHEESTSLWNLLMFFGSNCDMQSADMVLGKEMFAPRSIASGDFNNNGYVDVFVGTPSAPIEGIYSGGVVQHFVSPLLTGAEEKKIENLDNLTVTPNPTYSDIELFYESLRTENINILVTDINGRQILKTKGISNSPKVVSLRNLSDGVYFVNVSSSISSQTVKTIKLTR